MNRTIKFQLSNIKKAYFYSALISYGTLALFWLIASLFDGPEFVSNLTAAPIWLVLLTLIFIPFTFLSFLYALFDGLMFFDTALRFGISRQSYFITQLIIYIGLTLMLVVGNGLSEIPWTGTASTYFSQLSGSYLSIGNLASEFIHMLVLGILALAVYRYKVKALIPLVFIGPILGVVLGISFNISENTFLVDKIIDMVEFIVNHPELSTAVFIVVLIGIYYLFITRIEVQD